MSPKHDPKFISRRTFLSATAAALGGLALSGCGQSDGGGQAGGTAGGQASAPPSGATNTAATQEAAGAAGQANASLKGVNIKWSTWGNAGEIQRFQEYTADFNQRTGANAQLIPQPQDYEAKLLTQLSGGSAPDLFYSGDATMSKLISTNQIMELTEMLSGPNSKSKPEDVTEGLWGPAKTEDGKIWGMPVDCNPLVFWYNKQLLQAAGVTTMPADLQKQGQWNWSALQDMTQKVVATGKRGVIFEAWFGPTWGWVTTNGGKVFEGNTFVAVDDPKAKEAFQYVLDNLKAKTFTYSGTLPKGQGLDAMFLSQQTAFVVAGRWLLPQFKKAANLQYDIAPWPTNTSNKIEPATIATAYMVQNVKAANKDAAFAMLTDFVSPEGQKFRLQGGGNAVPSVSGADEVVSEGNLPPNWQAFIDAREIGYAVWPGMANFPGLSTEIEKYLSEIYINGGEAQAVLQKIADLVKQKQGAA
ncbi:MAG TPA: sugar ABC transporter substrate-binding protein [Herpetosiphonaceae bacterium]